MGISGVDPKWLGCTKSLAQAFDLVRKTGAAGKYVVFSQATQQTNHYEIDLDGMIRSISTEVHVVAC